MKKIKNSIWNISVVTTLFVLSLLLAGNASVAQINPDLEDVMEELNENYSDINSLIPNRYDFYDGETGYYISDGGDDMYDGGNYLGTNLGGYIYYTDNSLSNSNYFGGEGKYFTCKYPGLFVLAADLQNINTFVISGNLGADGAGNVDGTELISGAYKGFVKRVYNTYKPTVNHLIMIKNDSEVSQYFSSSTNDDEHSINPLLNTSRLYYLLFSGQDGYYCDNSSVQQIMDAFVALLKTDSIPPNPISNLTITDVLNASAMAAWLAPSDDSLSEPVSAYDIRLNDQPITAANIDAAPVYPNEISPANPGADESLLIEGLTGQTQYWIGIRSVDEGGNLSSPVVTSFTTGTDPEISVSITSMDIVVAAGENTVESFSISNIADGASPLSFDIEKNIAPINDIYSWVLADNGYYIYKLNLLDNSTESFNTGTSVSKITVANKTGDLWLASQNGGVIVKSSEDFSTKKTLAAANLRKICIPKDDDKAFVFRSYDPVYVDVYNASSFAFINSFTLNFYYSPEDIQVSNDGEKICLLDENNGIRIYNAQNGAYLGDADPGHYASSMELSSDGNYAYLGSWNGYVSKINLNNYNQQTVDLNYQVFGMGISNDGQTLFVSMYSSPTPSIFALNTENLEVLYTMPLAYSSSVINMQVSSDDRYLYTLANSSGWITTYDLQTKQVVRQKQMENDCRSFAFMGGFKGYLAVSPLSGTIASFGEQEITISLAGDMMSPGSYNSTLHIHSNDVQNPLISLALNVEVKDLVGPDFNISFFQNHYLSSYLKVLVFAGEKLLEMPELNQGAESLTVEELDSIHNIYNSEYKLTTTENISFTVSGKDSLGNVSTFERALSSTQVFKDAAITATYPNEEVQLDLPSGNFDKDLFVTIWKEEVGGESIYHLGPEYLALNKVTELSVSYAKSAFEKSNPRHLSIYAKNAETNLWEALPSVFNKNEQCLKTDINALGLYKLGYDENVQSDEENAESYMANTMTASPNPFSGQTLLSYEILNDGDVQISIFDLAGNKVSTLLDAYQTKGKHVFSFDGSGLRNGIYFYKLTTASGEQVKRLVKIE